MLHPNITDECGPSLCMIKSQPNATVATYIRIVDDWYTTFVPNPRYMTGPLPNLIKLTSAQGPSLRLSYGSDHGASDNEAGSDGAGSADENADDV